MSGRAAQMLEDVELGAMIQSIGKELILAQTALDLASTRAAEAMAATPITFDGESVSLLDLGLVPSFYQLVETTIELKLSISMSEEKSEERATSETTTETHESTSVSIGWFSVSSSTTKTTKTTSVDARFASRFQYSAEASSRLSTRVVPVPPPAPLLALAHALGKEGLAP